LTQAVGDITLVFDKGNNSEENLEMVADAKIHFVGSLVPTHHPELLKIERAKMRRLDKAQLPAVWSFRTKKTVFGVERTVLVTFNRPLFVTQTKTLHREINKRKRKLRSMQASLERSARGNRGKKPTLDGTNKRLAAILAGRHMKDLFVAKVSFDKRERLKLRWRFDEKAWKQLQKTLLGKTILFTDRKEWTDEEIVRAYRSQSHVESAFRGMKDPTCLAFRPVHHWTDQKLRVHALYCVIALMILSLLRRKLAQAQIPVSLARMVERLTNIKEVVVLYHGADAKSPRARRILSETDAEQTKMIEALGLSRFVAP
jgi:transposase